jgi:DNA-binding NtrC family response regulator
MSRAGEGGRRRRLLLVEDHPIMRRAMARLFASQFEVEVAAGAQDALARFAPKRFDIVVTSYRLGYIDGVELLSRLRRVDPGVLRVIVSGTSVPEIAGLIRAGVVDRCFQKPITADMARELCSPAQGAASQP